MHASLTLQYVVIGIAVAASAGYVLQSRWPAGVRRMRIACAIPLVRESRPAWVRAVGKWIAPRVTSGGAGCDDGCDGCSSH
jgi:hypothetical protein